MATSTAIVTGRYLDANGTAVANAYIYFRLKQVGADDDVTPKETFENSTVEVQTDASGDFSTTLWVNGDSDITSVYEVRFPTGQTYEFIIPTTASSGTIDLSTLLALHQPTGAASQQNTTYNLAIDRTNHTGGPDDLNGNEIILDVDGDTSITADTDDQIDIKIGGADEYIFTASTFDINANELILDADADTSITADTDDQIDFKTGGSDRARLTDAGLTLLNGFGFGGSTNIIDIETALTDDDTKLPTSGAVVDYAQPAVSTRTVTSTTDTLTASDKNAIILVDDDTAGSAVTVTLLAAATAGDGFEVVILKKGSTANVIIDGDGAETINGATTQTLTGQYESIKLVTDGTEWFIIEA